MPGFNKNTGWQRVLALALIVAASAAIGGVLGGVFFMPRAGNQRISDFLKLQTDRDNTEANKDMSDVVRVAKIASPAVVKISTLQEKIVADFFFRTYNDRAGRARFGCNF